MDKKTDMKKEISVPSVGESVTEAEIEKWEKHTGETVRLGETLALLETDKASLEIPAEQDGILTILKQAGETVSVGEVIGYLDTLPEGETADSLPEKKSSEDKISQLQKNPTRGAGGQPPSTSEQSRPSNRSSGPSSSLSNPSTQTRDLPPPGDLPLSPSVRRLIGEKDLNPLSFSGTGKDGRLTKEDILKALQSPPKETHSHDSPLTDSPPPSHATLKEVSSPDSSLESSSPPVVGSPTGEAPPSPPPPMKGKKPASHPDQHRERMSRLRKTTAKRLLASQRSTATLSTFNEADMSQIIELRKKHQEEFIKKRGVKLGFMSFFVKAVVTALKKYPRVNAFIDGEDIVYNNSCHIGIAVSTDNGLVVPVIHGADKMSFAEIEKQTLDYSEKARSRKLTPEDLSGGTFTVSNGGVFGSLLSTPILNPPQSGILGMHKIELRPVALNGQVVIRPMMYLTLSYDHRMIDGRESVGFLMKVKEYVEDPARILIDI